MSVSNKEFTEAVTLDSSKCHFAQCKFQMATVNGPFVYASNQDLDCVFSSCLFFKISTNNYLLCLRNAKTGIQDKCCYSEDISITHLYSSYSVRFGSINSTAIHNNQANSPYWKSSEEFTSFFNNHSYLQGNVNCYALYPTPYKEDNNCFFSGSSGVGNYPVHHASTTSNCVLTKFNLVNNSDSSGYIFLRNGNKKRIKDSVISFKSKSSLKWLYIADSAATLSIEGCFASLQVQSMVMKK